MKNRRNKIVYISGPYTAKTKKGIEKNIQKAKGYAIKVWDLGFSAHCPHLNTYHFHEKVKKTSYEDFIAGDLAIVNHCDAVLMIDSWESSPGAKRERDFALKQGIPVFYSLERLDEWGNKAGDNGKSDRLKKVFRVNKGIGPFSYVAGVILGALAGYFLFTGDYLVALLLANLIALKLITLIFLRRN